MPLANRDKESLYPPGKLSLWFLGTSAVLVVAVFWMLADDFVRPWKKVQRDFFKKQAALYAVKKDVEEAKLAAAENPAHARLRELSHAIAAARQALDEPAKKAELADLRAKLAEQKLRIENDDRQIKALKGSYAATVNAMEYATADRDAEKAAKLREQVGSIGDEMAALNLDRSKEVVASEGYQRALDALLAPLKELERERDAKLLDLANVETALGAAKARTESNQWRNLPMADIINPSIKIEKFVLDQIHDDMVFATSPKVEMCYTCHRGIDGRLISEREDRPEEGLGALLAGWLRLKFGEKAWERLQHPTEGKDAAADARATEKFRAMTSPGGVRGWLTGSKARLEDIFTTEQLKAALGDDGWKKEVEGKDLLAAFRIEAVQWAHPHLDVFVGATSPHPITSTGCTVCHAGVGRRIDFTRATHTPRSKEQAKAWEEEHGWSESGAEFVDFPMLPARYVEGQCIKCHGTADPFKPERETLVQWELALDKNGSPVVDKAGVAGFLDADGKPIADLNAATPVRPDWQPRLDAHGRSIVSDADGASKGLPLLVRRKAPKPIDAVSESADGHWRAETRARGIEAVMEWGCTGCHNIKDFEKRPGYGDPKAVVADNGGDLSKASPGSLTALGNPKLGPDLTHLADKTTVDWVERWIAIPNSFRKDTRMPSFYIWRAHDDLYNVLMGADGRPQDIPVVVDPTQRDLAQIDVEVLAIASYLIGDSQTRIAGYPEVPAGDVQRGAKTFHKLGCYGCHVGPGRWDLAKDAWSEKVVDDGARFRVKGDKLPPGPRLDAIGSKYTRPDAMKMLAAWILEPRHYNSVTRMPNLIQGRPELAPDNKTVVRSATQIAADLAAYLLSAKDPAFEAQPSRIFPESDAERMAVLDEFWMEYYGKKDLADSSKSVSIETARAEASKLSRDVKLKMVGKHLVRMRGCYGCHNIRGLEKEQPVGKELTEEGSQDLHKFDFGVIPHDEIAHTRWDFIENKLKNPRIFDRGRFKPNWADKLRMPRFNFVSADREAVTAIVLGMVKEPIKSGALPKPNASSTAIAKGRAVIQRYGCTQCHNIEGRRGVLTAEQADRGLELWMLPPNLYGEGNRVRPEWLFQFLKNPYLHQKDGVRPAVIQRMPMFRLSDDEAAALVDYFLALAGRKDRLETDVEDEPLDDTPYPAPVVIKLKEKDADGKEIERELTLRSLREEAAAFFDKAGCVKCHLPKGAPGTETGEGASAPPFTLAGARLQRGWMFDLLHNPQNQIQGTKMPSFWSTRSVRGKPAVWPDSMSVTYPQFLLGVRFKDKPTNDEIAEAQMSAVVRYLRFHYQMPAAATGAPPEPVSGK